MDCTKHSSIHDIVYSRLKDEEKVLDYKTFWYWTNYVFVFQLRLNVKAVNLSLTSIPKYIIDMQNNTKTDTENVLRRWTFQYIQEIDNQNLSFLTL